MQISLLLPSIKRLFHQYHKMPSITNNSNPLIDFYDPLKQAKDSQGRTLQQVLSWNDDKLEYHHDYIQILFPLPEGSPFNPSAPVIDYSTFTTFHIRPELRSNLQKSLLRMLHFYGFGRGADGRIVPASNFALASRNWVRRFNHNHLRITRIIRSMRVLGLENDAHEFFMALKGVYGQGEKIGPTSMLFWSRAMERPLFIAPEDDEDEGHGVDFLYDFERERNGEQSTGL